MFQSHSCLSLKLTPAFFSASSLLTIKLALSIFLIIVVK